MRKIRLIIFTLLLILFAGSITVYASDFALSAKSVIVNVGDTYELEVTGTEKKPYWTTGDINKVRVSQEGSITGVRKGKAIVSARIGLSVQKCMVSVVEPSIKLNKKEIILYVGEGNSVNNVQLKATVKGASKKVFWESSNPTAAVVDETGKIVSVSAGNTIITATANGKSESCVVTVKNNSISLNIENMQLSNQRSSMKLIPTVIGTKKTVKWFTTDKNIATVSGGKVTGKGNGTAIITAVANGVSASCTVNVIKDSVSIHTEKEILYIGETKQLKTNAGKKEFVTWTTSDEAVVKIDATGKITAVNQGTAVIKASLNGTEDTCQIIVKNTKTRIGENAIELKTKGKERIYTLGIQIIGRKNSVQWSSSDKSVAVVNSKGKVTAKKAGTAIITATANGVSDIVIVTVKDYSPSIKLNYEEYVLYSNKGNKVTIKAAVDGMDKKVQWNSSDESVATVKNGKVTAQKEGKTVITATANGIAEDCLISVKESKVIPEEENIFMELGSSTELPVKIIGASQKATYKTTNSKVVTVKNGILTAKDYGEADIKVTANGVTSVCHVFVDKCVHEFKEDNYRIAKEPTCIEEGIKTYFCTKCIQIKNETIPKKEHSWQQEKVVEAACVVDGTALYSCTNCRERKQEVLEAVGHEYGEWSVITEASKFTEGIEKQYCEKCKHENVKIIPTVMHEADEHNFVSVVTEPTCIEEGYTTHTCECGVTYQDTYVTALGHSFAAAEYVWSDNKLSCTATKICMIDDYVETETATATERVSKEPSCNEEGQKIYIVTFTKEEFEPQVETGNIEALGHDYAEEFTVEIEPTCIDAGSKSRHCIRCEEPTEVTQIDALGHSFKEAEYVWTEDRLSCTATRVCVKDNNHIETETASSISMVSKKPSCIQEGEKIYIASFMKDVFVTQTETESVEKLDHDYAEEFTTDIEPSCTEAGSKSKHCSRCEEKKEETEVEALGHDYAEEFTTDIEPSCTEAGRKSKHCSRCEEKKEETEVEALGHDYAEEFTTDIEPSCTEAGRKSKHCSRCEEKKEEMEVEALGHDWSDWEVTEETMEEVIREEKRNCSRCEETESREAYAPGAYDVDMNLIASWEELINTYGLDIEKDYTSYRYPVYKMYDSTGNSAYYVLNNNESLASVSVLIIDKTVTKIGEFAFYECSSLSGIEIPESVTTIGASAFSVCRSLNSIEIPSSVTTIGASAFSVCSSLSSIEIGGGVTTISASMFHNCRSLSNIEIPSSVTMICSQAFQGCSSLSGIEIPSSVTMIEGSAFSNCNNLSSIVVEEDNTSYDSRNNCNAIIHTETNELIVGCKETVIPNSVTAIGNHAFYQCSSLSSIELPDSVTRIGIGAFVGCSNLSSIEIPTSITTIDNVAFSGCSSLSNIELSNSVTTIGASAFYGCSSLSSVEFPSSVTTIGDAAFGNCDGLRSIVVDENNALYDSRNSCNAIINSETNELIIGCKETVIPDSVTAIGASAFDGCSSLDNIEIPSSVTTIGDFAFQDCSSLSSIEIADSVTTIGRATFNGCSSLSSIEIPSSVTTIGDSAFGRCSSLSSIEIPNSVTTIGGAAFGNCNSLRSIVVDEDNTSYDSRNNCNAIIDSETNELIVGCKETVIPDSVSVIGDYAFDGCSGLSSIEIPNSVRRIGWCAFAECSSLNEIKILNSITGIDGYAFSGCRSLSRIEIPSSVKVLSCGVFAECSNLSNIELSNSVTRIEDFAFRNCSSLSSIEIPSSVTWIGDTAFSGCSSMNSVEIPSSVTEIGKAAFFDVPHIYYTGSATGSPWGALAYN